MYLTPYQKKQLTIVLILVFAIPLTIFGGYQAVRWITGAAADSQPQNIVITNVTTSTITVTWTTNSKLTGAVVPVLNGSEKGTVLDKRGNSKMYTHYVELKNLEPGTEYDFIIISGSDKYSGSDDKEFSFSTARITTDTPVPKPVYGELNSGEDTLIYILTKDKSTYPVSTVPSSNGNWLVDLSSLRKVSDGTIYPVTDSTELIVIAVSMTDQAGVLEGSYGELFNSSGGLTEELATSGSEYISNIGNEARLVASDNPRVDTPDDEDDDNDDDDYDGDNDNGDDRKTPPPDTGGTDEGDDDFDREYELRNDLKWIDMVSTEELDSPVEFGPETVEVTNLTESSFSVIWYSEEKESGHIMYGTAAGNLTERGRDERDNISTQGEYYLHSIEVTQLQPETQYYFEVYSNDQTYEETYEITTFTVQSSQPQFETISGTVDVQDYESVVVIAKFRDDDGVGSSGTSHPISVLVDSEGTWILTIGGARDDEGEYFNKSDSDIVILEAQYLGGSSTTEMTVGEATSGTPELTVSESAQKFVRIPLLEDYRILMD